MDGSILTVASNSAIGGQWDFGNMTLPTYYELRRQMGFIDTPRSLDPADVEEWLAS